MIINTIKNDLRALAKPEKREVLQRFFKTGPGEYGEGDLFLGVMVPDIRAVAKQYYRSIGLRGLAVLARSPYHEERLLGLVILTYQFENGDKHRKKEIYDWYLRHTRYINNWDLVDLSAHEIVGAYLEDKQRGILKKLARSARLWERRIAVVSTYHFIRNNEFADTLSLAAMLLEDREDLIHKAVGWMLREVGKRNERVLKKFLNKYYRAMPRTMLRYAIERFPRDIRASFLKY
jgi:3-methyladenine DNA glycosylase AlkD